MDRKTCQELVGSTLIRIALDISCLIPRPLTGVGYYTLRLTRALLASCEGLEVRLFASSARAAPDCVHDLAKAASSLRTVRWPTRLKNRMWTTLEWPPIEWFTGPVDIAHGAFHLLPAARRARRMATVFDLSGLRRPETRSSANLRLHAALLRHAVSKAHALVAISESCKADLVELLGAPARQVHVVYGGVSIEEFSGPPDPEALSACKKRLRIEGEYFIHLGTLEPRKNLPRLIEAYARVRARCRDCPRLVLAGTVGWMYDEIFAAIRRLQLEGAVVHTGYLDRRDAVVLLRGSRACVYPSLYEGFGLPVLEAMAARTPVLTSNVSSLPEIAGDTALLVDPESTDAIEAGLTDLIQHREAALRRADAGYERAKRFTWEKSAESLGRVYRSLAEEGAP